MSLIANHTRAIFFDYDDTLTSTIPAKWAQHKHVALTYYQKQLTDDDIKPHWGKPLHELISLLYGADDPEAAYVRSMAHSAEFPKKLFPTTTPTLQALHDQGKIIGLVTATIKDSLAHDLLKNKILYDLIDYLQSAEDTDFHKPDPRVFTPAITWLHEKGISPHEVLYVGDGLHDMKAALGAGFDFLGVETGLVTAEEFQQHGAKSISSIAELIS